MLAEKLSHFHISDQTLLSRGLLCWWGDSFSVPLIRIQLNLVKLLTWILFACALLEAEWGSKWEGITFPGPALAQGYIQTSSCFVVPVRHPEWTSERSIAVVLLLWH